MERRDLYNEFDVGPMRGYGMCLIYQTVQLGDSDDRKLPCEILLSLIRRGGGCERCFDDAWDKTVEGDGDLRIGARTM